MKVLFSILITFFACYSYGQLQTSTGMGPAQLVQDVLIGEGVEVSNVSFLGSNQAIGTFDATNAVLGIQKGIILTTGTVMAGPNGPHGPNNKPDAGIDNGAGQYGPLETLVNAPTFNASVLEFDFIPYSDTVSFRYIFASEEYPEYVGTEFNDVFAFFITGPGIPPEGKNMAIVPGTSQEVTINNVNHLPPNSNYYQNNGDGTQAPYNASSQYIQYDGFTVPLTAYSAVECGETYHLVIAIADVSDPVWDSGIFLEANSLNSEQPVKVSYELTSDPYGDGVTMAQNCSSAIVTIKRSGNRINETLTVPITVSGTAIEGLDYSTIPSSVTFSPGETIITFTIDALNNTGLTDIVNLVLEFGIVDACGNDEFQDIELFIQPVEPVAITLEDEELLCPEEPVELIPDASGGGGDYTYIWSTGETTPTIMVNPAVTTTYTVSVTDDCLNETATASAEVTVVEYEPINLVVTNDIFEDCPFVPNVISVTATGGSGVYTYVWTNEEGVIIGIDDSLTVKPGETTTYTIEVTDYCGEVMEETVTIHVLSPPLILTIDPKQYICPGDSVEISVSASGGMGDYYYYWVETGETTESIWVSPSVSTKYTVIVMDDCQTFQVTADSYVDVVSPTADFLIHSNPEFIGLPVTFQNQSQDAISYIWDFGDGGVSTMTHPNNIYTDPGNYTVTLIATDQNGCKDTIAKPIRLLEEFYLYVPNAFTPDGNRHNHTFGISSIGIEEFHIRIFNRWGELLFEARDAAFEWDGSYGGVLVPDGVYVWKMEYTTVNDKEKAVKTGHVTVLR